MEDSFSLWKMLYMQWFSFLFTGCYTWSRQYWLYFVLDAEVDLLQHIILEDLDGQSVASEEVPGFCIYIRLHQTCHTRQKHCSHQVSTAGFTLGQVLWSFHHCLTGLAVEVSISSMRGPQFKSQTSHTSDVQMLLSSGYPARHLSLLD